MNIEISDEKYWKEMTYYDGLLYLSLLSIDGKNDWRMIKYDEEDLVDKSKMPKTETCWLYEDGEKFENLLNTHCFWIIPVREV